MAALRMQSCLFDIAAWRALLAVLRAEPPCTGRDLLIEDTEAHIQFIRSSVEKLPVQAH